MVMRGKMDAPRGQVESKEINSLQRLTGTLRLRISAAGKNLMANPNAPPNPESKTPTTAATEAGADTNSLGANGRCNFTGNGGAVQ